MLSIKVLQPELVFCLSKSSGQDQENNNSARVLEKMDVTVYTLLSTSDSLLVFSFKSTEIRHPDINY